ncbi:MAG: VIT domain-containing protein [Prosthecobacter sp.]
MKKFLRRVATFLFWLGIGLPLFTLGFEAITHACAAQYFDPLPTWWHGVLIALVPAALIVVWRVGKRTDERGLKTADFLHGMALVPAVYYLAALGPLSLMACWMLPFTLIFIPHGGLGMFGLVLATLGPLAALAGWLVAAVRLRRWHRERRADPAEGSRWPWAAGLSAGVLALGAVELPMVLIYGDLSSAIRVSQNNHGDPAVFERLRTPRREAFLLRLCYVGGKVGDFGPLASLFDTGPLDDMAGWAGVQGMRTRPFNVDSLRDVYFRVTGQVFSDAPPPRNPGGRMSGTRFLTDDTFSRFTWDDERGGPNVGARLRGLSLAASRMDWHLNKESALAYGEWTLEFRNENSNAQEARCQMLLPPRGCVSRLTLWINGEPREAAFGSKQQVTEAYRQTVVVERRDPVLVNMIGPDRVMTQCFPVPPGGTMKIRLGITAPVDERVQQRLALPLLIERNFSVSAALKHAVWVQGDGEFSSSSNEKPALKESIWSWQDEVVTEQLPALHFAPKDAGAAMTWTEDPFASGAEGKVMLRERNTPAPPAAPAHVIAVVDGSAQLRAHADVIRESLKALTADHAVTVLLSTDAEPQMVEGAHLDTALSSSAFQGGRDSVPVLKQAMKQARSSENPAVILWLHGPQPFAFSETDALAQILERVPSPPVIHAVSLAHGRNRVLEQLYNHAELRAETRWDGTKENLLQIIRHAIGEKSPSYVHRRANEAPADGIKVWDQLARHAVFEEVLAAFKGQNQVPAAQAQLAAGHQLVTPYSGAVVLELQEQYDRAGLKPVDASTAPEIPKGAAPEPQRTLLLLLGLAMCGLRRSR